MLQLIFRMPKLTSASSKPFVTCALYSAVLSSLQSLASGMLSMKSVPRPLMPSTVKQISSLLSTRMTAGSKETVLTRMLSGAMLPEGPVQSQTGR